ncbi:MAG: tRNA epoxyqueuosine(34) reductase QueG [Pseudomonadota bacterium]
MPTLISDTDGKASGATAKAFLVREAHAAGFGDVGVADPAKFGDLAGGRLKAAVAAGHHGEMSWLRTTLDRRSHPHGLWPEARAIVMLGQNYGPARDPMADLTRTDRGVVSVYARGRDYHDVMKGRMKTLAQRFVARYGGDVKVFVDTAPVMEKPLAQSAGIGWQGKHTNLVSRRFGSWLFLGAIFTTLALPADAPHADRCGRCRRCLDVCPTDAFPAPYKLDARRCLAYLTIEAPGMIPRAFRAAMGNRIFGCDDCLAVCPWNRFAQEARDMKIAPPHASDEPPHLADLAGLDDAAFRKRYAGTPVKRLGRERFVRNVMVAVGNAPAGTHESAIREGTADDAPQVRAASAWAARRTMGRAAFAALRDMRLGAEHNSMVRQEWRV